MNMGVGKVTTRKSGKVMLARVDEWSNMLFHM